MFKREILQKLEAWKVSENRKPLILRGARQVGKTTAVNQFGEQFDNYLYINLENKEFATIFQKSDNVKEILQTIFFIKGKARKQGDTLLFIDEIQCEPKAVALLRYFYEEMPELFVIAAGSSLQSLLNKRISFPVGRVEYLTMKPCSFVEYLNASGNEMIAEALCNFEIPNLLHTKVMELYREYTLIGGMPEVVNNYVNNRDIIRLNKIYNSLLTSYNEDVEKYTTSRTQIEIIRMILERGWQISGQGVTLSNFGNSTYKSREVGEAFANMERAFLCELIYPVTSADIPVMPNMKRTPKLIWLDGGLVNFAAKIQREVFDSKDLSDAWRGHIAEHWVAQELALINDNHYTDKRCFWVRAQKNATAEVDFVYQHNSMLIPIEVKSGNNAHLRSLHEFINEAPHDYAVRVWSGEYSINEVATNAGKKFKLINIPFYYVEILDKILERVIG